MFFNDLKRLSIAVAIALCTTITLQAQDTLRLTIPEIEKQFLEKNLQLIAEKFNISAAQAQVLQARLYNNPNISFTGNIYNPDQKKWLDVSNKTGEYGLNVQQLIILAGKRNKQVKLAETNVKQAENSFFDLLRTLRYTVRSDFYNIFFLQNSVDAYKTQVASLERLNGAYEDLLTKGIVTLKDAIRIKSLLYSLKAEQTSLQNQLNDLQAEVQLLLHNSKSYLLPVSDSVPVPGSVSGINLQAVIDSAYMNRYDLRLAENNLLYNEQNYALQKALRVPDLTLGAQFDKRGSFVNNASFISAAIDLPFFNHNQGNIKAAKINIDQSHTNLDLQKFIVENDVQKAYSKAINTEKMLQSFDPQFRSQFERLLKGVTDNFQKKNISLIEFTDFYESYKENILQVNQLQYQRMQAIEDLNFAVGKNLYQ
jgi:cobalt-zinc-cadmium efflux system outer membrane protein